MSNFGNDSIVDDYDSDCDSDCDHGSDWDNASAHDEQDDLWDPMPGQD